MSRGLRLTVLGAGYLGITHAACMAGLGFDVLGVDTDRDRLDRLNAGYLPIYEPGLGEPLRAGLGAGRVKFTTSYREAAAFGDVHFICTGTPQRPGSDHADLSQVDACVATLAPLLDRPCLVAGKSTVPVGTARRLAAELGRACPAAELAWNPEFLREGSAVADTLSPDRIVGGVTSGRAERTLRQVYARPLAGGASFIVTSLETAELAKAAANAFLATKISFINAMAEICEAAGGACAPWRTSSVPTRASARPSCAPGSATAVAACRRTSGPSWPAPASSAPVRRWPSCARLTRSTCGAHVVLLLTEWPEFTALTPGSLGGLVARRNIIDARNALDPGAWREAGWNYRALGMADGGPARRSVGAVPLVRDQLADRQG